MTSSARLEELQRKFEENPRRYFAPLANEYRKAGDPDRAVELCQQHLPQQPGHMSGHVVLAQSLLDLGKLADAREAFQTALDLDPENLVALRSLGDIHARQGELDAARRWYHRVLDVDPRNPDVAGAIEALDERGRAPESAREPEIQPPPAPPGAGHLSTRFPPPPAAPVFEMPVEGSFATGGDSPFVGLTPPSEGSDAPAPDTVSDFEVQREAELLTAGFYADVLSGREAEPDTEPEPSAEEERMAEAVDAPESELDHLFGGLSLEALESERDAEADAAEDPFADAESGAEWTSGAPRESIEMPDMIHAGADDLLTSQEEDSAEGGGQPVEEQPAVAESAGLPEWEFEEIQPPDQEVAPPQVVTAPEPAAQAAAESAPTDEAPFVTETMAELLLRQGFREQALDVYQKLLRARPDDVRLQERVEQLTAAGERVGQDEGASGGVVAEWLARLVAARPRRSGTNEPEEHRSKAEGDEDTRPIVPIESLLAGPVEPEAEQAAGALAAATVSYQEDRAVSEQLVAATADDPDSLERVLGDAQEREAQLRGAGSFSFDQFFRESAAASPPAGGGTTATDAAEPEQSGAPPSEADAAAADLAEFHAWLAGLSRP